MHHQARLTPDALGRHRGGGSLPRRRTLAGAIRGDRRTPRQEHGPTWRSPAKFSRSSTTAYETARSAVLVTKTRRDARHPSGACSLLGKAPTHLRCGEAG